MEKPHVEEGFESEQNETVPTPQDVSNLSAEEIQAGVKRVIEHIAQEAVGTIIATEQTIGKRIKININATLKDGRKLHIRLRE